MNFTVVIFNLTELRKLFFKYNQKQLKLIEMVNNVKLKLYKRYIVLLCINTTLRYSQKVKLMEQQVGMTIKIIILYSYVTFMISNERVL